MTIPAAQLCFAFRRWNDIGSGNFGFQGPALSDSSLRHRSGDVQERYHKEYCVRANPVGSRKQYAAISATVESSRAGRVICRISREQADNPDQDMHTVLGEIVSASHTLEQISDTTAQQLQARAEQVRQVYLWHSLSKSVYLS